MGALGPTDSLVPVSRPGFLLSRRWGLFLVAVVLLTWLAYELGQWQFSRLEDRRDRNATIERNENLPPVDVREVFGVDDPPEDSEEWRVVEATGEYATDDTVIVRYRTREGSSGVEVVVPLVLDDGTALLVDRGWWATANRGEVPDDVPDPPDGEVEVTGWVRVDAEGDSTAVVDGSTRAISSVAIGDALDREVLRGFVELRSEDPSPATELTPVELPALDEGPHFFYGLQWWLFGFLAVAGFAYLLYDEWRGRRPAAQRRTDGEATD